MPLSEPTAAVPGGDAPPGTGTPATCTACQSGRLVPERVKSAFWDDARLVVVEDIPALVCTACGEQYLDDRTALQLDLLKGSGFPTEKARRTMTVPVFAFADPGP